MLKKSNIYVKLRPDIDRFHYQETPYFSLWRVFKELQKSKQIGKVIKYDKSQQALGVQFPNKKQLLWFKEYEVVRV